MLHNSDYDLCETEIRCASRLWVIERLSFDNPQMRFHTVHSHFVGDKDFDEVMNKLAFEAAMRESLSA